MYFKNKLFTRQCLALVIMVAPTVAHANTNSTPVNGVAEQFQTQSNSETSAWVTYAGLHPNTDTLINAIAASESHGLNADSYALETLQEDD